MSEEVKNPPETTPPPANDELKNVKAEFSRKMDNLAETNKALAAQLAALTKPAPAANKKVSVFEDEDAFAAGIEARAEARMAERMAQDSARQAKINGALQSVYADYPEIGDASSELHKKTTEILQSYPEDERNSTSALRAAALQAASDLDIKPKKKRQASNDDFALGSSNGQGSKPKAKESLTADHLEVAELFGLNIKDPKVKKNLEGRAKRTEWSRWAKPDSGND